MFCDILRKSAVGGGQERKMKNRKKGGLFLGAALFAISAGLGSSWPAYASSKTEVSLGVALAPETVSFDVPLYLTLCVTKDQGGTKVLVPDEAYSIRKGKDSGGVSLAVTGLKVAGVAGGDWALGDNLDPASTGKEISLDIGGVKLPSMSAGFAGEKEADLTASDSSFYNFATKRFRPIGEGSADGTVTVLPVKAEVPEGYKPVDQAKPTPQFRLIYTVSCLDSDGNVIDKDYDGPLQGH